jgi:hypothetical protein
MGTTLRDLLKVPMAEFALGFLRFILFLHGYGSQRPIEGSQGGLLSIYANKAFIGNEMPIYRKTKARVKQK